MKTRMLRVPVVGSLPEKVEMFRRAIRRQLEGEEYDVVHLRSAWGGRAVAGRHHRAAGLRDRPLARGRAARRRRGARRGARRRGAAVPRARRPHPGADRDGARRPDHARARRRASRWCRPASTSTSFDWEPAAAYDRSQRVLYAGRIGGGRGVRTLLRALQHGPPPPAGQAGPRRRRRRRLRAAPRRGHRRRRARPTTSSASAPSSTTTCRASSPRRPCAWPRRRPTPSARWPRSPPSSSSTWPAAAPWSRRAARRCRRSSPTGRRPALRARRRDGPGAPARPPPRRRRPARAAGRGRLRPRARAPSGVGRRAAACSRPTRASCRRRSGPPAAGGVAHRRLALAPRHHHRRAAPCRTTVPLDGARRRRAVGRDLHSAAASPSSRSCAGEIVIEIDAPLPERATSCATPSRRPSATTTATPGSSWPSAPPLGFDKRQPPTRKPSSDLCVRRKPQVKMRAGRG